MSGRDEKLTSSDDVRDFRSLGTKDSTKQFIQLVGKGKEGWNCRSLFSFALFRQPKSRIFVRQATMRCLQSITAAQQEGHIFLSVDNYEILKSEPDANFRLSVDLSCLQEDIEYSELMQVAEIARYLNKSPLEIEEILASSFEGIEEILLWVNRPSRILYEVVIPRLFRQLYKIEEYLGPEHTVRKLLVKDPPEGEEGYTIRIDPALFVEEHAAAYEQYAETAFIFPVMVLIPVRSLTFSSLTYQMMQ